MNKSMKMKAKLEYTTGIAMAIRAFSWSRMLKCIVLGVLIVCASVANVYADVVSIGAVKDNTIFGESSLLSNGDGDHFFSGTTGVGNVRRGLIAFDIAANIPAGSVINSVTLTLSMSRTSGSPEFVSLHRLLTDWGEGTSHASGNEGGGAFHTNNDATWLYARYDSSNPKSSDYWTALGGDFEVFPSGTQTIIDVAVYSWHQLVGPYAWQSQK